MSDSANSILDQITKTAEQAKDVMARLIAAQGGQVGEPATPPPFPVDILPPALRRYVDEASASLPVPPEMIANPMLVMAGGLIGNRAHFQLKRGWYEYPTLYMVVVAKPGQNKSPSIKLARAPLQAIQRDARAQYRTQYEAYEEEHRRWKAKPPKERGEEPRPPKMRDVYTTDVTLEALAGMLEKTPGLTISTDELSGWIRRMNQYRQGGDREQYMSIWAGEPIKVDRKGAGSVYVDRPVLGVFGGIQPDVVPTLHSESQVRDGFVDRILPFIPTLPPKTWNRNAYVSEEAEASVVALYRAIDNSLPLASAEDVGAPGIGVQMNQGAEKEWAQWSNENNALAVELGGFLGGYYTKLEAHVARFALILHILTNPTDPRHMITVDTMRDAIALGEFFRGQMNLFLPLLVSNAPTSTKQAGLWGRILRLFEKKKRKGEIEKSINGEIRVCLTRNEIKVGLGNIRAEELTKELDTQTDSRAISYERVPTATKPVDTYCLTISRETDNTETDIHGFSVSPFLDISSVEKETDVRQFDFSTVRQSEDLATTAHINGSNGHNGHVEPEPDECGTPTLCRKLGPCRIFQESGKCWSESGADDAESAQPEEPALITREEWRAVSVGISPEQWNEMDRKKAECEARCAALRKARGNRPMPSGGTATIIQHSAVFGQTETRVRKFEVHEVAPAAGEPCSVSVSFVEPRKRRGARFTMYPKDISYLTIEDDAGTLLYDSRHDVPCDMARWQEAREESINPSPVGAA